MQDAPLGLPVGLVLVGGVGVGVCDVLGVYVCVYLYTYVYVCMVCLVNNAHKWVSLICAASLFALGLPRASVGLPGALAMFGIWRRWFWPLGVGVGPRSNKTINNSARDAHKN